MNFTSFVPDVLFLFPQSFSYIICLLNLLQYIAGLQSFLAFHERDTYWRINSYSVECLSDAFMVRLRLCTFGKNTPEEMLCPVQHTLLKSHARSNCLITGNANLNLSLFKLVTSESCFWEQWFWNTDKSSTNGSFLYGKVQTKNRSFGIK